MVLHLLYPKNRESTHLNKNLLNLVYKVPLNDLKIRQYQIQFNTTEIGLTLVQQYMCHFLFSWSSRADDTTRKQNLALKSGIN